MCCCFSKFAFERFTSINIGVINKVLRSPCFGKERSILRFAFRLNASVRSAFSSIASDKRMSFGSVYHHRIGQELVKISVREKDGSALGK
ncbi:Uncharacterised protein [Candidatus Bartonella washoeensis]|nr:Uncharacterised protein [Bartonella washoeensis]